MTSAETQRTPEQDASATAGPDEVPEEPQYSFEIQLCLIAGLIVTFDVIWILDRILN